LLGGGTDALMRKVLFIFGQLTDADVGWLAKNGHRQRLAARSVLIHEKVPVETLYIVLQGELAVVQGTSAREVARLGAGEIVGEMSFIDARPPSATVLAATDVVVYAISKQRLQRGLADDVAFAARFYKAVATFLSDRVREATADQPGGPDSTELDDSVLDNLDRAGARFDDLGRQLLDA
jgi:CRP-like cAMP-binding protein